MLLLLFHAQDTLYAIDCAQVVEIVSRVNLHPAKHCPAYIAGLFNYQDSIVPVVDLCQLLHGRASRPYLSTRIMIVKAPSHHPQEQWLGLMAERVTETLNISEAAQFSRADLAQGSAYLGEMIKQDNRMIQRIHLDALWAEIHPYPMALTTSGTSNYVNDNVAPKELTNGNGRFVSI